MSNKKVLKNLSRLILIINIVCFFHPLIGTIFNINENLFWTIHICYEYGGYIVLLALGVIISTISSISSDDKSNIWNKVINIWNSNKFNFVLFLLETWFILRYGFLDYLPH